MKNNVDWEFVAFVACISLVAIVGFVCSLIAALHGVKF